jgi:hypothetical protein
LDRSRHLINLVASRILIPCRRRLDSHPGSWPDRPEFGRVFSRHDVVIVTLDNLGRIVRLQRGLVDALVVCHMHRNESMPSGVVGEGDPGLSGRSEDTFTYRFGSGFLSAYQPYS